ncbi:hypothetical protein I3843_14G074400 [Carya illinoinensis]|uniref:Uncharacterized protein n=1 Tax=Carya illinoinensis TaxID=32201 RepID=A0A922D8Z0_CARIL|nr:hypothetical protein I3842_14G076100 [Carya illinoinensis]KAG7947048.1 hypothetical protein I3843_14G074400 [Carya illinoinensis]
MLEGLRPCHRRSFFFFLKATVDLGHGLLESEIGLASFCPVGFPVALSFSWCRRNLGFYHRRRTQRFEGDWTRRDLLYWWGPRDGGDLV